MLKHQLDVCYDLADLVLADLTDEEALWCPSSESWTVRQDDSGHWRADWTETEPWPAPPTSIAWIQWHVIWWWSTVLDRTFGNGHLQRHEVTWPGAAEALVTIAGLREQWIEHLDSLSEADLADGALTKWPYTDGRPFCFVAGWVNVELTKNIAEMCQLRRLTADFSEASCDLGTEVHR